LDSCAWKNVFETVIIILTSDKMFLLNRNIRKKINYEFKTVTV